MSRAQPATAFLVLALFLQSGNAQTLSDLWLQEKAYVAENADTVLNTRLAVYDRLVVAQASRIAKFDSIMVPNDKRAGDGQPGNWIFYVRIKIVTRAKST